MRAFFLIIVCIINVSSIGFAQEVSQKRAEAVVGPEVLQQAMADATKEYEKRLKSDAKKTLEQSPSVQPVGSKEESSLLRQYAPAKKSILENLADEVDALQNKVVIERTTLLATQSPKKVKVRGAKTVFNYCNESIYEVTSAVDHVTDIELKPGETLTTPPVAGDTVRWNIGIMKSGSGALEVTHVILKPLDDTIETNLIITTDEHIYQLKLRSSDFHMPAVAWNYPDDGRQAILQAIKKRDSQEPTISPDQLRFSYNIKGRDYSWKPIRVFDDGKKTFIQMPKDMRATEAPALFLIDDSAEPMLVNYRLKGDFFIIDRLFQKVELRVGPERKITIELDDGQSFFSRIFG